MTPKIFLSVSFAFIILLLPLSAPPLQAQTPLERHEKIRAAMEGDDYASAVVQLRALRASEPTVFALNNYDYLLARLSQKRGDTPTAAASYQAVIARNSLLAQYSLWHLAQLARSTGNLILERENLRRLILVAPASLLREAALARLGQSFFESGDYASAISALHTRSGAGANAREALALIGQAYLKSGQQSAAREAFNSLITQLPDASRPDDFALAGARGLDQLDSAVEQPASKNASRLPESEHLRRALIYNFNRDFDGARLHYLAIAELYPQSASVPDALYQIGRTFYQEGRFDEAVNYFKRVLDQFPQSASARDALSFTAAAYARSKRTDEAVAAYQRFIERYADAPSPERSYLNIIDALHEAGREQEALTWVQQTRTHFKGTAGATLALFSQARIHLAQGAWASALADLDALRTEANLGGTRFPGGTSQTEIAFTSAYTLEQLGRIEEAVDIYLAIPDGRNEYYGGRATQRLLALAASDKTRGIINARVEALRTNAQKSLDSGQDESARQAAQDALRLTEDATLRGELLEMARRAYARLPAYHNFPSMQLLPVGRQDLKTDDERESANEPTHRALANELLFLRLYDEGAPELYVAEGAGPTATKDEQKSAPDQAADTVQQTRDSKQAQGVKPSPPARAVAPSRDAAYTLAVYFKRGEHADHAIRFAEPIWKNVPADYLLELAPREMVELLYPAPYASALLEAAPSRGVDPRFVLAIARQESRFLPSAKSVSAARGLLQFIPSTANTIAGQLGKRSFQQDDLYAPRIAVLFGSQYLGNLFKQFPDMPQAVAAAYNGGEDNVARWVARARSNEPDRYVLEIGFTQSKDYVFKVLPNYRVYQTLYTEQLQRK